MDRDFMGLNSKEEATEAGTFFQYYSFLLLLYMVYQDSSFKVHDLFFHKRILFNKTQ